MLVLRTQSQTSFLLARFLYKSSSGPRHFALLRLFHNFMIDAVTCRVVLKSGNFVIRNVIFFENLIHAIKSTKHEAEHI